MGELVNSKIKPALVFWTGDVVPHDQWTYSTEYVASYQQRLADFFKANFSQYAIFPIEGNHDFGEANCQDFRVPDPILQINLDLWKDYLDEEAQKVYAKQGYYTQKLKLKDGRVFEKYNIVAINSQPCYEFNWYLWSQRDDPGGVLAWLKETFEEIERRGEYAIVISHIPTGEHSCLYNWAIRYRAIADRFQHLIRFSIYGHVHFEQHNIVRQFSDNAPVGIQYWTGASTSHYMVNPTFRVFELDIDTMLPLKVHTYKIDLRQENPSW